MDALSYELFIRKAFSLHSDETIDRGEDSASLADTDVFNNDNIAQVKSAIIMSMEIFNNEIILNNNLEEKQIIDMKDFIDEVDNATELSELSAILESYKEEFSNEYI